MTKLILHMGGFRTGSTSTQSSLWSARRRLHSQGILYPKTGLACKAHHALGLSILGQAIQGHYAAPPLEPLLKSLEQEIASSGCGTVLISTEVLMLLVDQTFGTEGREERLGRFLSMFGEVQVLCVIRHQVPLLESTYRFEVLCHDNHGQPVTEVFTDYVHRWLSKPILNYSTIERFLQLVRPNLAFKFLSFAIASESGSLVKHFFQHAGLSAAYRGEVRNNESQSRLGTLAILMRNRGKLNDLRSRSQFLGWSRRNYPDARESLYDANLLKEVANTFHDSNSALAAGTGFSLDQELITFENKYKLAGSNLSRDELQNLKKAFAQRTRNPLLFSSVREYLSFLDPKLGR